MANVLSFVREETYTLKVYNRIFAQHTAHISTTRDEKSYADIVTNGVTYHYRKQDDSIYTGAVHYMPLGNYSYQIHTEATHSAASEQLDVVQIDFTPNSTHADKLYLKSGKDDMSVPIYIINKLGDLLNTEQFFYLLGIRQSNRLYTLRSHQRFIDSYVKQVLPAGVERKVANMPPTVSGAVPTTWSAGGATVNVSGVATDPEDDILTYAWSQTAPTTDMDSNNLLSSFASATSLDTTATLTTPPVDRQYSLKLAVSDSDNTVSDTRKILVSGTHAHDSWGDTEFKLGDAELPYTYLS